MNMQEQISQQVKNAVRDELLELSKPLIDLLEDEKYNNALRMTAIMSLAVTMQEDFVEQLTTSGDQEKLFQEKLVLLSLESLQVKYFQISCIIKAEEVREAN